MKNSLASIRLALILAFVVIAGSASTDAYELRPGVVVEPQSNAMFVAVPGDSLTAVSPANGTVIWETTDAQFPVAAVGSRLVARIVPTGSGVLPLVVLDLRSGARQLQADIPLPQDVRALVDDALGERFSIRTLATEGSSVTLVWRYSFKVIQGPYTPEADLPPDAQTGAFRFDTVTGEVSPAEAPSREPIADIELGPNERVARVGGRQFRGADDQHILASEWQREEPSYREYSWTFVDGNGDILGEVASPVSYAPFHVTTDGSLVAYVLRPSTEWKNDDWVWNPLSLRGVNLEAGREVWVMEIRDTTYYGPFPE